MKTTKTPCEEVGHDFFVVPEADTRKTGINNSTEIWKTLVCRKCGLSQSFLAAVWAAKKGNFENAPK